MTNPLHPSVPETGKRRGRREGLAPTHLEALQEAASPEGRSVWVTTAVRKRADAALFKRKLIEWGWVWDGPRQRRVLVATKAGRQALAALDAKGED